MSLDKANKAKVAQVARAAQQASLNELAAAASSSKTDAAASGQEYAVGANPYTPAWTSIALHTVTLYTKESCIHGFKAISKQKEIFSIESLFISQVYIHIN